MRELKRQFVSALLVIITVAAVVAGAINFTQQSRYRLPDDGVTWTDEGQNVVAAYVAPGSPGANKGLRVGDVLISIEGFRIGRAIEATQALATLGSWRDAKYLIRRNGSDPFEVKIITGEADRD